MSFAILFTSTTVWADSSIEGSKYISKSLQQNVSLMEETFGDGKSNAFDEKSTAEISIGADKESVEITLNYKGAELTANLSGTYDEIQSPEGTGYVGVYEGFASPIMGRNYLLNDIGQMPILADITFDDSNIFAAITLGSATASSNPDILFYGDLSNSMRSIASVNTMQSLAEAQAEYTAENETAQLSGFDATTRMQDFDVAHMGGREVGVLSIYHADSTGNAGNLTTYAKVNTRSDFVLDYIKEDLGYGSGVVVYPDTFNISIGGTHDNLHAVINSYEPQNAEIKAEVQIPVPVFDGLDSIGIETIPFSLTMSSTKVTTSKYSSDSPHSNNTVSWEIYKRLGWNPDTFDGGYNTQTGLPVASTFTYEGNVSSPVNRGMRSTATIRYEYISFVAGTQMSFHLNTETMTTSSVVTIHP